MFTGIVERTATVRSIDQDGVWFDVSFAGELKPGQSVACDGVCLTVVEADSKGFRVDLLEETKRLSRFATLNVGDLVNVERSMRADGRFDGHIVQGHCEGVGVLKEKMREKRKITPSSLSRSLSPLTRGEPGTTSTCASTLGDTSRQEEERMTWLLTVQVPRELMKYMVYKGIIILNGVALTIAGLDEECAEIQVAIIPYTWEHTNLQVLEPGGKVNVETDVVGKYVEKMLKT